MTNILLKEWITLTRFKSLKSRVIKRNSILLSWLISYVLILLIPVIISGYVYSESIRIIEREINNSNTVMLKQIQENIDKKWQMYSD